MHHTQLKASTGTTFRIYKKRMAIIRNRLGVMEQSATQRKVHPDSGEECSILSVQLPDGTFAASINGDPAICGNAASRQEAQDAADNKYLHETCDFRDPAWTVEETARYNAAYEGSKAEIAAGNYVQVQID